MISPQICQFQGRDGQRGLDGLRAHISSTPYPRCRSIFMTPALWTNVEGFSVIGSRVDLQYEVVVAGCLMCCVYHIKLEEAHMFNKEQH